MIVSCKAYQLLRQDIRRAGIFERAGLRSISVIAMGAGKRGVPDQPDYLQGRRPL